MDKRKVRALSGSFPSGASLHPIWSDLLLEPRLRDSPFSGGAHFMCRLPNFRAKALDFAPSNAAIFSGRFKLKTLWSRVAGRSAILLTSRNPGYRHGYRVTQYRDRLGFISASLGCIPRLQARAR